MTLSQPFAEAFGEMMHRKPTFAALIAELFSTAFGLLFFATVVPAQGAETYRKLSDSEIKTKLSGMEMSDPHSSEQYMRDGTVRIVTMGLRIVGKWRVTSGRLCIDGRRPRTRGAKRYGDPATNINSAWKVTLFPTMLSCKSSNHGGGDL